jgi:DMSO reductase family type II enzyme chaperone
MSETTSVDADAGARGALYGLLASLFETPSEDLHDAAASGELHDSVASLVGRTTLDVDVPPLTTGDDRSTLSARYNDLFEIGFAEYENPMDGTLASEGPPVPLYETAYREDVSWNDVNLDLARAYDYFGIEIDTENREHHDRLPLQLEFAGYLARREAAVDEDAAAARLDFLDRHLRHVSGGVAERIDAESGTGLYGDAAALLESVVDADRRDLGDRLDDGGVA